MKSCGVFVWPKKSLNIMSSKVFFPWACLQILQIFFLWSIAQAFSDAPDEEGLRIPDGTLKLTCATNLRKKLWHLCGILMTRFIACLKLNLLPYRKLECPVGYIRFLQRVNRAMTSATEQTTKNPYLNKGGSFFFYLVYACLVLCGFSDPRFQDSDKQGLK